MYHELLCSIHSTLHRNEMVENFGASRLPRSSRDLLDQLLCPIVYGFFFYRNAFLNENCLECGCYPSLTHVSMRGVKNILGGK